MPLSLVELKDWEICLVECPCNLADQTILYSKINPLGEFMRASIKQIILSVLILIMARPVYSDQEIKALEPNFKLNGRSMVDLSEAWWKWSMSIPGDENPVSDITGNHCGEGQKGNVWFLAGGFGSSKIKRSCVIPSAKYLFFPIINMAYWPREEKSDFTCIDAIANAALNNDTAIDLFVEVDGVSSNDLKKFRARTKKCFDIFERMPKAFNSYKAYPSASDGYWLLFKPFKKGKHQIKFGGRYNKDSSAYGKMVQDIEYEITIK
jgi:hypothetical protein